MEDALRAVFVNDVARDVVSAVAPEELPVFAAVSEAFAADPDLTVKGERSTDEVLGFGSGMGPFLTPIVLSVVGEVIDFLIAIARKAVHDGLSAEAADLVKAMLAKFHTKKPATVSILTREQLVLVHDNVLRAAKRHRLPAEQARDLADAVMARLVLAKE